MDPIKLLEEVHDLPECVLGEIYMVRNIQNGLSYIGQTLTHRMNHTRYRPYGYKRRFKSHVSEALCNTKKNQCSCISNAIRKYGAESFEVILLARCEKKDLDDLEESLIEQHSTIHPNGYNLAPGGKTKHSVTSDDFDRVDVQYTPQPRSTIRTQETKEKMALAGKKFKEQNPEYVQAQFQKLKHARLQKKLQLFQDVQFQEPIEQYVITKASGTSYISLVKVGSKETSFFSKYDTKDECRQRAIDFIKQVQMNQTTIATSSN